MTCIDQEAALVRGLRLATERIFMFKVSLWSARDFKRREPVEGLVEEGLA